METILGCWGINCNHWRGAAVERIAEGRRRAGRARRLCDILSGEIYETLCALRRFALCKSRR